MVKLKSRYDEAESNQSKYCYPGTDVLINKLDIKNQEELDIAERRITTLMLTELQVASLPKPNKLFSADYYLSLHKKVFSLIYSFAGETRNENITKGNTPFCRPEFIYNYLSDTLNTMAKKMTKVETKDDITTWLADCYGELNIIHPFREGNGRIAREFLRESVECMDEHLGFNYELDFSNVTEHSSQNFMNASIISAIRCDNTPLKEFFDSILKEKNNEKIEQPKKGR